MPNKNAALYQALGQANKLIERGLGPKQKEAVGLKLNSAIKAGSRPEEFYNIKPIVFNVILFVSATMGLTFLSIDLVGKYFNDLSVWLLLISKLLKYLCVIVFLSLAFASPITDKILKIKQRNNK